MDKERYDDYKLLAMNYGKLEECIYEDGTFSILLTYSSYIKGQQLAAYIEQKDVQNKHSVCSVLFLYVMIY